MCLLFLGNFFLTSLFLAPKSVCYTTLIHLGILWGKGPGAYEKGVFGVAWGPHSSQYIDNLYTSLVEKFKEKPFGPFDAFSILIGDANTRVFCLNTLGLLFRPPLSTHSTHT